MTGCRQGLFFVYVKWKVSRYTGHFPPLAFARRHKTLAKRIIIMQLNLGAAPSKLIIRLENTRLLQTSFCFAVPVHKAGDHGFVVLRRHRLGIADWYIHELAKYRIYHSLHLPLKNWGRQNFWPATLSQEKLFEAREPRSFSEEDDFIVIALHEAFRSMGLRCPVNYKSSNDKIGWLQRHHGKKIFLWRR